MDIVISSRQEWGRGLYILGLLTALSLVACVPAAVSSRYASPSPGTIPRIAWWEIPECPPETPAGRPASSEQLEVEPPPAVYAPSARVAQPSGLRPSPGAWEPEREEPTPPAMTDEVVTAEAPSREQPSAFDTPARRTLELEGGLSDALQSPSDPNEQVSAPATMPAGEGPRTEADSPLKTPQATEQALETPPVEAVLGSEDSAAAVLFQPDGTTPLDIAAEHLAQAAALSVPPAALPAPVSEPGISLQEGATTLSYPKVYQILQKLMGGRCAASIRVQRMELENTRTDGGFLLDVANSTLIVSSFDPDYYQADGFEPQLLVQAARLCLAQRSLQQGIPLSRSERGLRFLEEGFAHYLRGRPELSSIGGQPQASRTFVNFAAQVELRHHVELLDLWDRLPDDQSFSDPDYPLHPRRQEATLLAAGYVQDLIDAQGLGLDGFIRLFEVLAENPFKPGPGGVRIPKGALIPTLSAFLAVASQGQLGDISASWSAATTRILSRQFQRPGTQLWTEGAATLIISFSTPMQPDRIDLTLDGVQIGPERLMSGLGQWRDERTVVVDLRSCREQMGLETLTRAEVNFGRIWQWFRGIDGIPAEGGLLFLP